MTKYEGQDHYLDPETGVLKNRLGIKDKDELKKAEASLVAWRSFQLSGSPIKGISTSNTLKLSINIFLAMFTIGQVKFGISTLPKTIAILPIRDILSAQHARFSRNWRKKTF